MDTVTFREIELGDLFWDSPGNLVKKVSSTQGQFLDGDKNWYFFHQDEQVRKETSKSTSR